LGFARIRFWTSPKTTPLIVHIPFLEAFS
jgi:hypothetical protein